MRVIPRCALRAYERKVERKAFRALERTIPEYTHHAVRVKGETSCNQSPARLRQVHPSRRRGIACGEITREEAERVEFQVGRRKVVRCSPVSMFECGVRELGNSVPKEMSDVCCVGHASWEIDVEVAECVWHDCL